MECFKCKKDISFNLSSRGDGYNCYNCSKCFHYACHSQNTARAGMHALFCPECSQQPLTVYTQSYLLYNCVTDNNSRTDLILERIEQQNIQLIQVVTELKDAMLMMMNRMQNTSSNVKSDVDRVDGEVQPSGGSRKQ